MQEVKENILKLWEEKQLRITDEIQTAPEVLYANGSVIGTLGNFSASTGKAKSKKTFNVAAIVGASLVNGKVLGYTAEFPDDKRTILYFDTEQSPYHCQKVMERALRLAKLPTNTHPEHLKFAALRQLTPALRLEVIEQAINQHSRCRTCNHRRCARPYVRHQLRQGIDRPYRQADGMD